MCGSVLHGFFMRVSWLDRIIGKTRLALRRGTRREARAKLLERRGELAGAVEAYLDADLPDEAARVLLLRADGDSEADRRLAFCAQAAVLAQDTDLRRTATVRRALLKLDILKERGGALPSELSAVGRELAKEGEHERAADAFALAGDTEAEVTALTRSGSIERLEETLDVSADLARRDREQELLLRRIEDLDRTAERRRALDLAEAWLDEHDDERMRDLARSIRTRLVRGPVLNLVVDGERVRFAMGSEVTVGRGAQATLVVSSRAISRNHLRVSRSNELAMVEDLGTRNGTMLAGARLCDRIPVGEGLQLRLGGEVPCDVRPGPGGPAGPVEIDVAGRLVRAPLGELLVHGWRIRSAGSGETHCVQLLSELRNRPFLGDYELAARIELAVGDALSTTRGGPVCLEVLPTDEEDE